MVSMIDLDYNWEAERLARIAHRRRMLFAKRFADIAYTALAICFIVAVAVLLSWIRINQERWERASYNEGRYGVSREVALAMADAGIGNCARELIDDYRAARAEREPYHVATVGGDVLGAPQKEVR